MKFEEGVIETRRSGLAGYDLALTRRTSAHSEKPCHTSLTGSSARHIPGIWTPFLRRDTSIPKLDFSLVTRLVGLPDM